MGCAPFISASIAKMAVPHPISSVFIPVTSISVNVESSYELSQMSCTKTHFGSITISNSASVLG
jgi:hypothetical protein